MAGENRAVLSVQVDEVPSGKQSKRTSAAEASNPVASVALRRSMSRSWSVARRKSASERRRSGSGRSARRGTPSRTCCANTSGSSRGLALRTGYSRNEPLPV